MFSVMETRPTLCLPRMAEGLQGDLEVSGPAVQGVDDDDIELMLWRHPQEAGGRPVGGQWPRRGPTCPLHGRPDRLPSPGSCTALGRAFPGHRGNGPRPGTGRRPDIGDGSHWFASCHCIFLEATARATSARVSRKCFTINLVDLATVCPCVAASVYAAMYTCQRVLARYFRLLSIRLSVIHSGSCFPGIEQSLQGGIANAQFSGCPASRHLALCKALQNCSKTAVKAPPVRYPWPADSMALFPRPVHAGFNPFPEDASLQLGISDGDVVEGFAEGRSGIQPGLGVGPETDSPCPQSLQSSRGIQDGAESPVHAPDQEQVELLLLASSRSSAMGPVDQVSGRGLVRYSWKISQPWASTNSRSGSSCVSGFWSLSEVEIRV